MNLYLLSIQKAPFRTVTMLTHYTCQENFTQEPNIYRGWTVYGPFPHGASAAANTVAVSIKGSASPTQSSETLSPPPMHK
jgi:hypothetical protein